MIENIVKYNFWNGNDIPLGYIRKEYTDRIGRCVGNNLVKVITGQRRVGKSYILRQIAHNVIESGVPANNVLYVNLEYMELNSVVTAADLQNLYLEYKRLLQPNGKTFVFIDEIQYVAEWERFVNSHSQDFSEPCELFISGSNSKLLSGELATMLSGRYVKFEVFPYSFAEYCDVAACERSKSSYMEYLHTGALPELLNLNDDEMRRNYMVSIRDTVMLRDIVGRYKVKDSRLLNDIFTFMVNNASSIVSISNIVNYFASRKRKTNYETVSAYIGYLEDAFLLHKAERYNIRGKETMSGNCKYYVNDLSFRNYLYGGFGFGDGHLMENAVYLDLRRRGFEVYVGNIVNKEVDFVAIRGDQRVYVQACLELTASETAGREYAPLLKISDNYPKYIVSLDDYRVPSLEGIGQVKPWLS